jgi:hypothetical protein
VSPPKEQPDFNKGVDDFLNNLDNNRNQVAQPLGSKGSAAGNNLDLDNLDYEKKKLDGDSDEDNRLKGR